MKGYKTFVVHKGKLIDIFVGRHESADEARKAAISFFKKKEENSWTPRNADEMQFNVEECSYLR